MTDSWNLLGQIDTLTQMLMRPLLTTLIIFALASRSGAQITPYIDLDPKEKSKVAVGDLEVVPLDSGKFGYSGQVLFRRDGSPAGGTWVYLMDNVRDGRFYGQIRADEQGFFSLVADYSHLHLVLSSSRLKRREVGIDEWPAIKELQRRIKEYYPDSRYGRKGLILDPESRIEIYRDRTFLLLDRNFNYESGAVLKGHWFTCREVASDLNINLKKLEEFREAHLTRSSIPYMLRGEVHYLNHVLISAMFAQSTESGADRFTRIFIDPTGLSETKIGDQHSVDGWVIDDGRLDLDFLKAVEQAVLMHDPVPLCVDRDYCISAGISYRDGNVYYSFAIQQIRKASPDHPVQVLDTYYSQLICPVERVEDLRKAARLFRPDQFLSSLPDGVLWAEEGSRFKMSQVIDRNIPIFFEMLKKAEFVDR